MVRGGYGMFFLSLPMRTLLAAFSIELPFKATFQYNPNSSAYSPDGNNSYLLTHSSPIIAGLNSTNPVDITNPNSLEVGQGITALSSDMPTSKIQEWDRHSEAAKSQHGDDLHVRRQHRLNLDQVNNRRCPTMTVYLDAATDPDRNLL